MKFLCAINLYIIQTTIGGNIGKVGKDITKTPFFYRTYPFLYHKFGEYGNFGQETYIRFVALEPSLSNFIKMNNFMIILVSWATK